MFTFLGDVALLCDDITSLYTPDYPYTVNLEYVVGVNPLTPVLGKINLLSEKCDLEQIFKKPPLAVNIANNHSLDFGADGLKSTLTALSDKEIPTFGDKPYIIENVCFLSYTLLNDEYNNGDIFSFNKERFLKDIDYAKKNNALRNVVHIHWGVENHPLNTSQQTTLAHWLVDNGADIVIGCHPHCIQPVEIYRDKYIVYSMGNCLFPNFALPSHFNNSGQPQRVYRFKWQSWNRKSLAIIYDPDNNSISHIDELYQKRNKLLLKKSNVSVKKYMKHKNRYISNLVYFLRKYFLFFISNLCVDGKFFDLNAIAMERKMKKDA